MGALPREPEDWVRARRKIQPMFAALEMRAKRHTASRPRREFPL